MVDGIVLPVVLKTVEFRGFFALVVSFGLNEVDVGNVGEMDGAGMVNGSSLIQRGRALLHCPDDKHVIKLGPSNLNPAGQEISAFDP